MTFLRSPLWLHTTRYPECYHGHQRRPPFFEGWYFKLVDPTQTHRLAIIPGVFRGEDPSQRHAFVQVLDGTAGTASYCRFEESRFHAAPRTFDVAVDRSRFSGQRLSLDINQPGCALQGDVQLGPPAPWPTSWTSPGVMGWYAWAPFMQCYHGIVSLDHTLRGRLQFNGRSIDFDGGRGYLEKDWGRSFPSGWIWMQSNHFDVPETCVTASVATIPWLSGAFAGFLVGVWHGGTLYRFTTYTGARIERLEITDQHVHWTLADRRFRLEIEAHRTPGAELLGPTQVEMGVRVAETLDAAVSIRLARRDGSLVFSGTGSNAGLEVCGDLPRLCRLLGPVAQLHTGQHPALAVT